MREVTPREVPFQFFLGVLMTVSFTASSVDKPCREYLGRFLVGPNVRHCLRPESQTRDAFTSRSRASRDGFQGQRVQGASGPKRSGKLRAQVTLAGTIGVGEAEEEEDNPEAHPSARGTRAARFGRSLSLPTLSVVLCLELARLLASGHSFSWQQD